MKRNNSLLLHLLLIVSALFFISACSMISHLVPKKLSHHSKKDTSNLAMSSAKRKDTTIKKKDTVAKKEFKKTKVMTNNFSRLNGQAPKWSPKKKEVAVMPLDKKGGGYVKKNIDKPSKNKIHLDTLHITKPVKSKSTKIKVALPAKDTPQKTKAKDKI